MAFGGGTHVLLWCLGLRGSILLSVAGVQGQQLEVFQGPGRCTGTEAKSLATLPLGGFGQCVDASSLGFVRADCVSGGGVQVSFFQEVESCKENLAKPILAPLAGKSGECFLLNPSGPVQATLSWEVTESCPEGIPMRFSEKCETAFYALAKNTAGFDAASGFGPRLNECRRVCDETWFKGGVNYAEFTEDCTCPVDYMNKGEGMRACEAAGGKSCFENIQLTNEHGAKLDITAATFDCIPQDCMEKPDFAIFERKKMLSCTSIPGTTGCKPEIECQDAPASTTVAPPAPAPEAASDVASPRTSLRDLSTALVLSGAFFWHRHR